MAAISRPAACASIGSMSELQMVRATRQTPVYRTNAPVMGNDWSCPADPGLTLPVDLPPVAHPAFDPHALPQAYTGPVVVARLSDLHDAYYGPRVGTQSLLQDLQGQGVPIVYYVPKREAETDHQLSAYPSGPVLSKRDLSRGEHPLECIHRTWPGARLLMLGNSSGDDAQVAARVGAHVCLRNTDLSQSHIPPGADVSLCDDLTPAVRERFLRDALSLPVGAPENPAPVKPATRGEKLAAVNRLFLTPLGGVPAAIATWLAGRVRDVAPLARTVSDMPATDIRSIPAGELAGRLDAIQAGRASATEKAAALRHALDAFADSPGARDRVLSRMRRHPADAMSDRPTPGDWEGFQRYADDLTDSREVDGNKVQFLVDGDEALPAKIAAIDRAKRYVNYQTFTFCSDATGWEVARALMRAADRGAQVRLFYDAVGSSKSNGQLTDPELWRQLKAHGVQLVESPPAPFGDQIAHRKIITMDSGEDDGVQVGFCGGANTSNAYTTQWHEADMGIVGPAVADLNRLFLDLYRKRGGQVSDGDAAVMLAPGPAQAGGVKVRTVGHLGHEDVDMKYLYLRAIDTAKESINIANPYLTDDEVMRHLQDAARRGVRVRLFLPHHNEKPPLQRIERAFYRDLLDAGVELYHYQGLPMAHEKVATFDGRIGTVGSSNLDRRSLWNNDEANGWYSDAATVKDIDQRLFNADLATSTRVVRYDPNVQSRLYEGAMKVAEPFF